MGYTRIICLLCVVLVLLCGVDSWCPDSSSSQTTAAFTTRTWKDLRGGDLGGGGDENVEIIEMEAVVSPQANESNEIANIDEEKAEADKDTEEEVEEKEEEKPSKEGGTEEEDDETTETERPNPEDVSSGSEEEPEEGEDLVSADHGASESLSTDEEEIDDEEVEKARALAAQLRLRGKELHDEGNWEDAAEKFHEASTILEQDADAAEELATCRLHEALCRLKQLDYDACVDVCTAVLDSDQQKIPAAIQARAHHRRAKAKLGLGDVSGALSDARSAAFLGDRKAVALYGRLMRETSSSEKSQEEDGDSSPALLNDLFQGRNPFMPPSSSDSGSSALMQSLLNKSKRSPDGSGGGSPLGALGDMASLMGNMGGNKKKGDNSLAKSVLQSLSKRLEDESTQDTICRYLQNTDTSKLQQLATMAGMTLSDGQAEQIVGFCHGVTPQGIQRNLKRSKRLWYVISIVRKTMQVLAKYKHIIVLLVLISWIKSAILRPMPIDKKAARKAAKEAAKAAANQILEKK